MNWHEILDEFRQTDTYRESEGKNLFALFFDWISNSYEPPKKIQEDLIEFKEQCPECKIGELKELPTTIGDWRDGIRHDKECSYCDSIFGYTKGGRYKLNR